MDLSPLLAPRSIAVVGANDTYGSYADTVLRNLATAGFDGPVWGVNPKRSEVHGRECVATLADLPEAVDAVVIAIPAAAVPSVVRETGERGCGGAVVLSAGFGEVESGRALEAELREAALAFDLPLCGPNGNGIVAVHHGAAVWGDGLAALEPGAVAMVTQSGNVGVNALGSQRGIRWHTVVSTGNQTVCDTADWLGAVAALDGVRSVALFVEADGDGARLAEALATCAERGVGVAVLKVGESDAGQRAASAHTGALAGDQRVFRALVEEAGGAWAEDFHDLLELAKALGEPRARPSGEGGLAVLTCSGGDSGVAADEAARLGVELPALGAGDARAARGAASRRGDDRQPTRLHVDDLGRHAAARRDRRHRSAPTRRSTSCCSLRPPARRGRVLGRGDDAGLIDGAAASDAASIVASTLPDLLDPDAASELSDAGLPAIAGLRTALVCARALRASRRGDPARLREIAARRPDSPRPRSGRMAGSASGRRRRCCASAGSRCRPGGSSTTSRRPSSWLQGSAYPVAVKLSGAHLPHKSDVGGLALDAAGRGRAAGGVRAAGGAAGGRPGAAVLVEEMAAPGVELVVAARGDGVVPALVIGLGGVFTEVSRRCRVVPLPADAARVERGVAPAARGAAPVRRAWAEPGSTSAANRARRPVGHLLVEQRLSLVELNPVIARPDGAVAVDAVARH